MKMYVRVKEWEDKGGGGWNESAQGGGGSVKNEDGESSSTIPFFAKFQG